MALKLWTKDGKVIVDSNGRPIMCQSCPCVAQGNVHIRANCQMGQIDMLHGGFWYTPTNRCGTLTSSFQGWTTINFNSKRVEAGVPVAWNCLYKTWLWNGPNTEMQYRGDLYYNSQSNILLNLYFWNGNPTLYTDYMLPAFGFYSSSTGDREYEFGMNNATSLTAIGSNCYFDDGAKIRFNPESNVVPLPSYDIDQSSIPQSAIDANKEHWVGSAYPSTFGLPTIMGEPVNFNIQTSNDLIPYNNLFVGHFYVDLYSVNNWIYAPIGPNYGPAYISNLTDKNYAIEYHFAIDIYPD